MSTGVQGPSSGDPLRGLRSLSTQVHAQKQKLIDAAGLTLVRAIKLTLSEPGTGRVYRRGSRRATAGKRRAARIVLHRASAPGHPPAVDTGRLRNSIAYDRERRRVGTNVEYAKDLEDGTPRMKPRPFMRPTAARVRGELRRLGVTTLQLKGRG